MNRTSTRPRHGVRNEIRRSGQGRKSRSRGIDHAGLDLRVIAWSPSRGHKMQEEFGAVSQVSFPLPSIGVDEHQGRPSRQGRNAPDSSGRPLEMKK